MCEQAQIFLHLVKPGSYVEIDRGHTSPCWEWVGEINRNGYGTFIVRPVPGVRRRKMAHIEMYVHHKGEYDRELLLDHHCRNRPCCNPDHLEPVTVQVNTMRGNAILYKRIGNDY